ncbi:UMP-CMP kinase [Zootermopsis nevadensis]|uniref:UMP-CMP kinase n=1 Tax=Zootermopsis nevadensis TaxID=136037 RepID=A0A067RFI3_ZOONE|nr:UMP-CMP kinase [Zootermopsis nevadensis]KDR21793.1 UMP-CMP kinase [Zootermopsis nevadensis]
MFTRLLNGIRSLAMSSTIKPDVVFVLGAPGAGKGTQCTNIVKEFGFIHLSAGDLLREERNKEGSEYGELIEDNIKHGRIVPVEITCSLIEKAMKKSGSSKFLIDGFPRNQDNLDGWNRQMAANVNLLFVLFFDCPQEVCVSRCLERGAAGSGRSDDNPESLKKRFDTYMNDSVPIIQYYEQQNLVKKVDAGGTPDEVFEAVKAIFQNISPSR